MFFNNNIKIKFKHNVIVVIYTYEFQYINSIDSTINHNFNVVFLIINLAVKTVTNTINDFIIVQLVFKYDYALCDKTNY